MAQQPQQWYYRKGNERFGPINSAELKKKADTGEILPDDLLRMVGLVDWIPAANIKGLFPTAAPSAPTPASPKPTPKPVAPAQKPTAAKPIPKPASAAPGTASQTPPKPAPKPVQRPAAAASTPKPAPPKQPQNAPSPYGAAPDPFAAFGSSATPASDPFAGVPNPFANFGDPAAGGAMGGGFDLSNLVAMEKQGQALPQSASTQADPFASQAAPAAAAKKGRGGKQSAESGSSSFGFGFLAAPFAAVTVIGFVCGCICAWIPLWYFCFAFAVVVSKGVGMLAGNCLLKAKCKNEVISLGYGGLVGLFVTYFFVAASLWTYWNAAAGLNNIAARHIAKQAELRGDRPPGVDEEGRSTELRPDEPPMTMEDIERNQAAAEAANQHAEQRKPEVTLVSENPAAEGQTPHKAAPLNEDGEEEEDEEADAAAAPGNFGADRPQWDREQAHMRAEAERVALFMRLFGKGITVMEAISPYYLMMYVKFFFWGDYVYWLIMGGILVAITAHSTWMANLGHDPTSSGGF